MGSRLIFANLFMEEIDTFVWRIGNLSIGSDDSFMVSAVWRKNLFEFLEALNTFRNNNNNNIKSGIKLSASKMLLMLNLFRKFFVLS